ncbi:uncharacterized protein [Miscanthus floridulus]|uniref:uncharacterized protein n=1 Tax=Miscanthus floridulus TaxID=154761 RepID=UPI0034582E33
MNCYPQARVSWSTRTDADQREEAAPVSRHGTGHRRSPAALRSGRGRPPWADPGRRGARRGGAGAGRQREERRRRIRGGAADPGRRGARRGGVGAGRRREERRGGARAAWRIRAARGKEGRGRGRPPAGAEEGRGWGRSPAGGSERERGQGEEGRAGASACVRRPAG